MPARWSRTWGERTWTSFLPGLPIREKVHGTTGDPARLRRGPVNDPASTCVTIDRAGTDSVSPDGASGIGARSFDAEVTEGGHAAAPSRPSTSW